MKRVVLLLSMGLVSVGCFGACGSSDPAGPTSTETTTTTTTTSSGDDTTAPASEEPAIVVGTDVCATDADCVPAGCCHPAACVAVTNAPACGQSVCTSDCRYGTLDCGGGCLCHAGHCAARLSALPHIPGVPEVQ